MQDNKVLFVLNKFYLNEANGERALPKENFFHLEKGGVEYSGIIANEAPVKYLIAQGVEEGQPVTELVYLCSPDCRKKVVPSELAQEATGSKASVSEELSTEELLIQRIKLFCASNNYPVPTMSPIEYAPTFPANSLHGIVGAFKHGARISLDITGGRRDVAVLLSIAVQIIKMGFQGVTIGTIIYSSFEERRLCRQNNTFDMIELVNSIDSFTRYGRADQLDEFFARKQWVTAGTRALMRSMRSFSDSMALCLVGDIDEKVRAIHRDLNAVEEDIERRNPAYRLYAEAIATIDNPELHAGADLSGMLEKLRMLDPELTASPEDARGELRETLRVRQREFSVERNELLLSYLVPTIREKFIPETSSRSQLTIEIIRWCVNHQMMQQALCIFREHIGRCLLERGFFSRKQNAGELDQRTEAKEIVDLGNNFCFNSWGVRTLCSNYKVVKEKERELRRIAAWALYVNRLRNMVMHVDTQHAPNSNCKKAARFIGKNLRELPTLESVGDSILRALDAIEHARPVTNREWYAVFDNPHSA